MSRKLKASIEKSDWEVISGILACRTLTRGARILEIGMHKGYSAQAWIEWFDPSFFLGLEINSKPEDGYGNDKFHFWWKADSHDHVVFQNVINYVGEDLLDILFIDGDHSLEGVTQDFNFYSGLVKPQGLIIFHDCIYSAPSEQVKPLWEELKTEYPYIEIRTSPNSTGIGVIFNTPIKFMQDAPQEFKG